MKNKNLLVCTFSGGRTSAFMALFLKDYDKYKDFDKVYLYLNTGKEREETLEFIDKCNKEWKLNIIWIEAKINNTKGKGTDYKIVDFKTASRNGEPFEDMLKAYPMPNNFVSNCTRELKQIPMEKYIKSLGYKNIITAIGIRYDERHRISKNAKINNLIYPLCNDIKVDSLFIRNWWERNNFDLNLKDYQGNCDLCFKKSLRKKLTIIKENPRVADWWEKMEKKYTTEQYPRFDLRTNLTIPELIKQSNNKFRKAKDLHELSKAQSELFDFETECFCKAS